MRNTPVPIIAAINGTTAGAGAVIALAVMPDFVYKMQGLVTKLGREDLEKAMYHFLGLFKLGIIFLNVTPYLVLRLFF